MSDGFRELGLSAESIATIDALGYEKPTPVQAQAIPVMLAGRDLIAQAQTGTGKTAAFALPMIDRLDIAQAKPQALVLCPTRELAMQVAEAAFTFGRSRGVKVTGVYGGQPIWRQIRQLQAGVHVVVATPGRMLDHLRRATLDPAGLKTIVLDEADEMLAMGFLEDVEAILAQMPAERQVSLFSATMPAPIARLAAKYLKNPRTVSVDSGKQPVRLIRQSYCEVASAHKMEALMRIFDLETPGPTIVFCRTRRACDEVGDQLAGQGFQADRLHGDMEQPERDRVMKRFKDGAFEILVATDVASRGLDIESVTHVINFDVPWDAESYTHRIGRTGRAGREGDAITLIEPRERRHLRAIEKSTGAKMKAMRIPTIADIATRRLDQLSAEITGRIALGGLEEERASVKKMAEKSDPLDLAAALFRLLRDARAPKVRSDEGDINLAAPAEDGMVKLWISAGRAEGVRPADLVGAISGEAGIPGKVIGSIDVVAHASFVEVPAGVAERVIRALSRARIRNNRVRVQRFDGARKPKGHFKPRR
jgi:ATP-dependent RNA helicase DeaD